MKGQASLSAPLSLIENPALRPRLAGDARHVVITGFMGTGKSAVGAEVAARMGRRFVDMDALLEADFGKPISEVFAQEGEAVFRAAETELCHRLGETNDESLVIATGGGALVNPHNRATLERSGVLVCLTAPVDEILRRLADASDRPLLAGDDGARRQRVRDLLHTRRHAYAAIHHQVDTAGLRPAQVAECVLNAFAADCERPGMTVLPVQSPEGVYELLVGEGLLENAGALLGARGLQRGPVIVVSTHPVFAAHGDRLLDGLRGGGFAPTVHLVPDGEANKSLANVTEIYETCAAAKLDRRGALIALGGGVIGDMTGFAAATWLRGVPFVQCPTTLLSMVDASVGGKTGVDLPAGKNLVGAFKQPDAVLMDMGALETLPAAEFRSGLAEVVKHGVIADPDLFEQLEEYGPTSMKQLVVDGVSVKIAVVEEDPFEQGKRAWLNLGHTFGHAIEQQSGYRLRHGECVSIGMVCAAQMALAIGLCDAALASRIEALLERLGLPTRLPAELPELRDLAAIRAHMGQDKKRAAGKVRFVLPRALGDVVTVDSPGEEYILRALDYVSAS